MKTPLFAIDILSIYRKPPKTGARTPLPKRMAQCTPDTLKALFAIRDDLRSGSGDLVLSDLFRSHDMQLQAHLDFIRGKKSAFSPPPGGSMHEAGRACDLDLSILNVSLKAFWEIAARHGMKPIISAPNSSANEAWHFDCRGSHNKVRQHYVDGKGNNMEPYTAMAVSAILAIGVQVDRFGARQNEAAIQTALIRLGQNPGNIDGSVGHKTKDALAQAGLQFVDAQTTLNALEEQLAQAFPDEFATAPGPPFAGLAAPPAEDVAGVDENFEAEFPPQLIP